MSDSEMPLEIYISASDKTGKMYGHLGGGYNRTKYLRATPDTERLARGDQVMIARAELERVRSELVIALEYEPKGSAFERIERALQILEAELLRGTAAMSPPTGALKEDGDSVSAELVEALEFAAARTTETEVRIVCEHTLAKHRERKK